MKHKTLTCLSLISSLSAFAGTMGPVASAPAYVPVIAGIGGWAGYTNPGSKSFIGDNFDVFTFTTNSNQGTGYGGGFIGFEHSLPWYSLFYQFGAEYLYYAAVTANGTQVIGVDPVTSSTFNDQFQFQTQQVAASLRLLATCYTRFHPYFSLSLGGAWNKLSQYAITNLNLNAINIPVVFTNNTQNNFSYSLGAGIDTDITDQVRLALGYRYTDFGQATFGTGIVSFNNFAAPVPFTATTNRIQANAFFAQLSYIFKD